MEKIKEAFLWLWKDLIKCYNTVPMCYGVLVGMAIAVIAGTKVAAVVFIIALAYLVFKKYKELACIMIIAGIAITASAHGPIDKACSFIKHLEGTNMIGGKHVAYNDNGTGIAIGYGDTTTNKQSITSKEANRLLIDKVSKITTLIDATITVPLTEHQQVALTAFIYNVGNTGYVQSNLRKVINNGEFDKVEKEFMKWVYSKKKFSKGLKNRREKEIDLWKRNME